MINELYDKFIVPPGTKVKLTGIDPGDTCGFSLSDREKALRMLAENNRRIAILQNRLYSESSQSLLIVLQAMDAGGKDGTINNVFFAMNPQGCRVQSFKTPTQLEQSHDFLWRVHKVSPRKGEVVIFNRSYYESVLVEKVHSFASAEEVEFRYRAIKHFEELLSFHKTRIVKFYLHISKDEQLRRFIKRLDNPDKHWKISANDYPERRYWDDYISAFETMLSRCSTKEAPWFVIPSNCKWFRNLAVSQIILRTMESMDIRLPEPSVNLQETRKLAEIELAEQNREEHRRKETEKKK